MKNDAHYLHIGIGETNAMFTLWEVRRINGRVAHSYIKNLGNTVERAQEKALYAMFSMGIELEHTGNELLDELRRIERTRPTKEEIEARRAAIEERDRITAEAKLAAWVALCAQIDSDEVVFGKHKGNKFANLPVSYINWLVEEKDDFEEGTPLHYSADYCARTYGIRNEFENGYVGAENEKIAVPVTVIRTYSFTTQFGLKVITTMRDDEGRCIVVKSTSFRASVGEKFKLVATVKAHEEYRGVTQTVVQRAKKLEIA